MKIKWLRYNRKKLYIFLFLFLIIFGLSFGYAFVTTKLSIDGVARVKDAKWIIYFDHLNVISGSVTTEDSPQVTNTNVAFSAKLDGPGSYYGFTVDIINSGTINAKLDSLTLTPDVSDLDYLNYDLVYMDDTPVQEGDLLPAGKTKKIKVLLSYVEGLDDSLYPSVDSNYNITIGLNYVQYIGDVPSLQDDDWNTIVTNVRNNPLFYELGDTKIITMDIDNNGITENYTLRVVNRTTPAECSTQGFSQTACGFVLEFDNIIINHIMNPNDDGTYTIPGNGNIGSWNSSSMRQYVNNDIYALLPSTLKPIIKDDTVVVTGYGLNGTDNYSTNNDKLYLLSPKELFGDNGTTNLIENDTAADLTRQLDYYKANGVTTDSMDLAIKRFGVEPNMWWLRTPASDYLDCFYAVGSTGTWSKNTSSNSYGVAPAFRIE